MIVLCMKWLAYLETEVLQGHPEWERSIGISDLKNMFNIENTQKSALHLIPHEC